MAPFWRVEAYNRSTTQKTVTLFPMFLSENLVFCDQIVDNFLLLAIDQTG